MRFQIVGGVLLVNPVGLGASKTTHYTSRGPYGPVPERGWTSPLRWTHDFDGTFEENQQLLQSFNWGWWSFWVLGARGMWIRLLHEKKEPWRKKQF